MGRKKLYSELTLSIVNPTWTIKRIVRVSIPNIVTAKSESVKEFGKKEIDVRWYHHTFVEGRIINPMLLSHDDPRSHTFYTFICSASPKIIKLCIDFSCKHTTQTFQTTGRVRVTNLFCLFFWYMKSILFWHVPHWLHYGGRYRCVFK